MAKLSKNPNTGKRKSKTLRFNKTRTDQRSVSPVVTIIKGDSVTYAVLNRGKRQTVKQTHTTHVPEAARMIHSDSKYMNHDYNA